MRVILQRVKKAYVSVDEKIISSIGYGYLLFAGIVTGDTDSQAVKMARKVIALRVMDDHQGKMNMDIVTKGGQILSVSQFTLVADTEKGNRPGFSYAANPDDAERIWKIFNEEMRRSGLIVKEGAFGKSMQVGLINDGPATFILE